VLISLSSLLASSASHTTTTSRNNNVQTVDNFVPLWTKDKWTTVVKETMKYLPFELEASDDWYDFIVVRRIPLEENQWVRVITSLQAIRRNELLANKLPRKFKSVLYDIIDESCPEKKEANNNWKAFCLASPRSAIIELLKESIEVLKNGKFFDFTYEVDDQGVLTPSCPICFETVTEGQNVVLFPCNHVICDDCNTTGFGKAESKCPVCTFKVFNYAKLRFKYVPRGTIESASTKYDLKTFATNVPSNRKRKLDEMTKTCKECYVQEDGDKPFGMMNCCMNDMCSECWTKEMYSGIAECRVCKKPKVLFPQEIDDENSVVKYSAEDFDKSVCSLCTVENPRRYKILTCCKDENGIDLGVCGECYDGHFDSTINPKITTCLESLI